MTPEDRTWIRDYLKAGAADELSRAAGPTEARLIEIDRDRALSLLDEAMPSGAAMPRGSVFVVVPCRPDQARAIDFFVRIMKLDLPPGSQMRFYPGFFAHHNRTLGVRAAIEAGAEYVFFVDDDQLLLPDTVRKLMAHDVDIVSVNLVYKERPFNAYMFERIPKVGGGLWARPLGTQRGLVEVDACGLGGVLVKTSVFKAITEHEWFAVNERVGTDDIYFCELAQKNGFKIHVDLEIPSGHLNYCSVWPTWNGERWEILVVLNNGGEFIHPAPESSPQRDRVLRLAAEMEGVPVEA